MTIAFNEKSFEVGLLHKVLGVLGHVVAQDEVGQRLAGEDTRSKVRALQAQLGTPVDETSVVDERTASAIQEALRQRGLATGSRGFTVNGTVRHRDGSPGRRQRVLAFDLDLRGVATYRTVKTVEEIAKSSGYEYLGYAVSDARGRYSVTFYDWQYRRAERKKADVVVFAVETDKEGMRILGRSRLVNSEDYSDEGVVQRLDITLVEPASGIEYQRVMGALAPFLEESQASLAQIVESAEQLAFTASELELDIAHVTIAAAAARLVALERKTPLSHELLYGVGRQDITLDWSVLARRKGDEITAAITTSISERIIAAFDDEVIAAFVAALRQAAVKYVLEDKPADTDTVNAMLSSALPRDAQRASFLNAVHTFTGAAASEFWTTHLPAQPEFGDNPKLISSLLFNQQLTLLTGNHQALVKELQVSRGLESAQQLLDLDRGQWLEVIKKSGVPSFIDGPDIDARAQIYAEGIEGMLNATFPTQRIERMVAGQQLPIETGGSISTFLSQTPTFDFARSRVYDFGKEIEAAAGEQAPQVTSDLMTIQRVFQVSTRPEAMATLLRNNLRSAYSIANVPRKSFMKTYAGELGGEWEAYAIHQRASHVAAKIELDAAHMYEYSNGNLPSSIMGGADHEAVKAALENKVPNYERLFGSPDICECEHCRSVYSPAAYFVDLLRFLWRSEPNDDGNSPLDMLEARRPDLLHLPLSCENTNTVIPYIDLANEVMEYYVAHNDSLTDFRGYDTGETTAEELRANPQHFDLEAYRALKDAKHPFTLPYHQPLDVIRTYSDHLKVSRYEAMRAINPTPSMALAAEALRLSEEEYTALVGEAFDGTPDATPLHVYFGYTAPGQLEGMSEVREFLRRAGAAYTDLVELVKTRFINPHQGTLEFIEAVFATSTIGSNALYTKLQQIADGTLDPATDTGITDALTAYNSAHGTSVTPAEFGAWVVAHFAGLQQVITLYEPESRCDLDTTRLRTIQSIYEGMATSGLVNATWSRIHRFIRLWRKFGWTVHETDLMLAALGQNDITSTTIDELASVWRLRSATKLAVNLTAVLWGDIDVYGDRSLYKKLFLNRAVQQIDDAFAADAWGNYLQDPAAVIADHTSAILAAFRMREDDLAAIFDVAGLAGTDGLNLTNLSTIYRHVVLAKALKLRIPDLCTLIDLFNASPFTDPEETYAFYELATAIKAAGFKAAVLEYTLRGTLPAESTIGLDRIKTLRVAKDVRETFSAIEQDHPDAPPSPLAREVLGARLALTFTPEIVTTFLGILDGTTSFEAIADANLTVEIPVPLSAKYTYVRGSGRLICGGVMTDDERTSLTALANINGTFVDAVDDLYGAPERFLAANFDRVFTNQADAYITLLDHPAQVTAATLEQKLVYTYAHFVPLLKSKLRRDAITQHIAALLALTEEATALLIAQDVESLIAGLSTKGLSAAYFNDTTWTTLVEQTTDPAIDFRWGLVAPRPAVNADNFSVRWQAYLAPPASGEFTFVVSVAEADEVFRLYLDDALILEKTGVDTGTSFEVVTTLNAARMHTLALEYAETAQNASVSLQWKTATTALEAVPQAATYPTAILDAFVSLATLYHRAAKFITGFELSETELDHFLSFSGDFGGIDFKALSPDDWRRIRDYTALRDAVPQAQALLTDVFAAANTPNPAPTVADLKATLHQATAWDEASLDFLVDTHFAFGVNAFRNEIALGRIRDAMAIVVRTGLTAETIAAWGAVETDFDALHGTAQVMKNTVKSKYEERDWLDLAGSLSDTLREHQQEALVAYLLSRPAIQAWGAEDADGLFEYFLIDVQMDSCMDTSRIVQGNSSIQMFVNRCLLNLESDLSTGDERGVSPGAIDKDRWEWMKAYRVWEANRKVFLYPENWLEPEWRNDRSEFFKELESYLVQNDITDRSVEQGFRNYLTSLNEVANIEVCGIHREDRDDGHLKYLHVFGRTQHAPFKYFYRRWNEYRKWSPWESVQVDIRGVEAGGANGDGGVHLIPVVWKKRLFLFWPEFTVKKDSPSKGNRTVRQAGDDSVASFEPTPHWEIKLGWTEYVDGKWSPKQVTKEFVLEDHYWHVPGERTLRYATDIDNENRLFIYCIAEFSDPRDWKVEGAFELSDIASRIVANNDRIFYVNEEWDQRYVSHFQNVATTSATKLELIGNTYLRRLTNHLLLPASAMRNFDVTLDEPFFFRDALRSYFVRPISVLVFDRFRHPDFYNPYLPTEVYYQEPVPIPEIGPDDYFPGPGGVIAPGGGVITATPMVRTMSMTRWAPGRALEPTMFRALSASNASATATMSLTSFDMDVTTVGQAFGGNYVVGGWVGRFGLSSFRYETGLEFHTFYHPFAGRYVTRLNQGEIPRLMESDTAIPSDEGSTFEDYYDPNTTLVPRQSDFATRTYYKQNVCFDVYGANSLYNWELFFHAPLYIATRLSRNGKYQEAMKWFHYIFDPTTDEMPGPGQSEISRYWKVLPFKTTPVTSLEDWFRTLAPNADPNTENATIAEWRDNPFDPHIVASNRPLAYMKHVVIKYVENLIAWGDSLFRQDTMESVNEALQIYVIANHILGLRPQFVPKRGEIAIETYTSLETKWDDFSNALVELENIFPYSSDAGASDSSTGTSLLGIGSALYFCIPANDKLLGYWDTVADRLFKIRHCQNIDGVERHLALFAPPIDPAALIQATSQGLSLGSILADLSSPPPIYRFTFLLQKANELCADLRSLGGALLAALEKKDGEELARLRQSHEIQMLELTTAIRERQVLVSRSSKENLEKSRETAALRLAHYTALLGSEVAPPAQPSIAATLTADSQLPPDTALATIKTDVDESLADTDEAGVKIITKEKEELDLLDTARDWQIAAQVSESLAAIAHVIPTVSADGKPFGVGAGVAWGGTQLGNALNAAGKILQFISSFSTHSAATAAKMAGFIRREQEWTLQANLAARDVIALDKQLVSAEIQIQVAEKELENHRQSIENSKQVEQFLRSKFSNQELYQWMKEQLFAVYKQSYNLCYEMAKKAEKAFKHELGTETASFIQYGYWDNSKQGLVAGDKLQLALRQLERAYLDDNRRELELSKNISVARLDPLALIELRETGRCRISLPEELFDLDFRGHYFRRIKAVRLSIPCVVGPHTSIACTLRLMGNSIRVNTSMNQSGTYEHENDAGEPIDDDRFRTSLAPVTAIATSQGQNDAGMFEFSFRDERYLPFERAGAISEWQLELSTEKDLRQFDYATITDVILHVSYSAREAGGVFKVEATKYLRERFLVNSDDLIEQPLIQMFSMKHELPSEWYRFLHPAVVGAEQVLAFTFGKERFPFFVQDRELVIEHIELLAKCRQAMSYHAILAYTNHDGDLVTSTQITLPQNAEYGDVNKATIEVNDVGLDLEELDVAAPMTLKLKASGAGDYTGLATNPDEVADVFLVLSYKLQ